MAVASQSPNRLMTCRTKLDYAAENGQPGPVAIFWDIKNCPVPKDAEPRDVSSHVRKALGMHHNFSGTVTKFCAYGDVNCFPTKVKEGLKGSGVQVVHGSHATDKAILAQILFFAMDNGVPSSIVLISDDVVFALALQELHKRKHTIAVAIPSAVHIASDLTMAAEVVWDWPSLARGKGVGIPRPLACPGDLHEDQATTVPTSVIDDDCVEFVSTEDVDAPTKDEETAVPTSVIDDGCVEFANTEDVDDPTNDEETGVGASSQATPVPELLRKC